MVRHLTAVLGFYPLSDLIIDIFLYNYNPLATIYSTKIKKTPCNSTGGFKWLLIP